MDMSIFLGKDILKHWSVCLIEAGLFAVGITNTVTAEKLKAAGANAVIKRCDELLNLDF